MNAFGIFVIIFLILLIVALVQSIILTFNMITRTHEKPMVVLLMILKVLLLFFGSYAVYLEDMKMVLTFAIINTALLILYIFTPVFSVMFFSWFMVILILAYIMAFLLHSGSKSSG